MQRWYVLALSTLALWFAARPPVPTFEMWTVDALEKVRPNDQAPADAPESAQISLARNEFEPFQIVLRANDQNLKEVDMEPSDLRGSSGAIIRRENVRLYFENYITLRQPSSIEGDVGDWPDALIPRTDIYFKERRNAFPFTLVAGRTQPIWVEVYAPADAAPGEYTGEIAILQLGRLHSKIPFRVNIWNFSLPSTSSLPTTFGFNGVTALKQHRGRYTTDAELYALVNLYRKSALLHRISVHGGSMSPPQVSIDRGKVRINWTNYDAEVGPFLEGHVLGARDPLPGAHSTTIQLIDNRSLNRDEQLVDYYRDYARHFREKKWFDRLFYYLWDEPKDGQSEELIHRGKLVRAADGNIRTLVTAPYQERWKDVVDIWTPLVNCFEPKPGYSDFCSTPLNRAGYNDELQRGKKLWWYQSCGTHGCNIVGGNYFRGWPSYMIDHSGVSNRIMSWLTWKYDIAGELYFNLDEAYSQRSDPWSDVYLFGGNGDGTLFYPGRPDRIGGRTDIPIESIRLKLIREGLEDYEYLRLYSAKAGPSRASEVVNSLVQNAFTYERSPEMLYAARERMGKELSR